MGTFDEPGKGLITFFFPGILFRPIKDHFFTRESLESLTDIFAGLGGGQPEGFSILGDLNFTYPVMLLQRTVRFSDLVHKEIKHTLLIARKTVCRLSQFV